MGLFDSLFGKDEALPSQVTFTLDQAGHTYEDGSIGLLPTSLTITPDDRRVAVIGLNGAGKTTTLHTITGLVPAKSGSITYDGHDLLKTHANKIVTLGMAHVPEGRHVFTRMSVQENLEMGAFSLKDQSSLGKDLEMVFDYFPRLKERRRQLSGTLSGGEQQMVAMGRALMSHPKTILMDEPSMGLSPLLVKEIFDIIVTLRKRGITVLLVEH